MKQELGQAAGGDPLPRSVQPLKGFPRGSRSHANTAYLCALDPPRARAAGSEGDPAAEGQDQAAGSEQGHCGAGQAHGREDSGPGGSCRRDGLVASGVFGSQGQRAQVRRALLAWGREGALEPLGRGEEDIWSTGPSVVLALHLLPGNNLQWFH